MNVEILKNRYVLVGYYLIFAFAIVAFAMLRPLLNWDMIAYVASAMHFEISNPEELHSFVYGTLKDYVDAERFSRLTSDSKYRIDMATDSSLFYQQLPFYQIRPIYTLSILALSKTGLSIFTSTYVISIVSVVMGIFLVLFAFKDKVNTYLLYTVPFFLLLFGVQNLARYSTPDAMVFLYLSLLVYLFNKNKISLLLFALPFSVLIRTDLIILNVLLISTLFFLEHKYRMKAFLALIITIVIYLLINNVFQNYGWSTIFSFTLIERISNPADANLTVSFSDYFIALMRGINQLILNRAFLAYIGTTLVGLVLIKERTMLASREILIYFSIPFLYILSHFVLFPVIWDRFFVGFYTISTIGTLLALTDLIAKNE